jgi:tetratricopeptide (TPR) repeat protein
MSFLHDPGDLSRTPLAALLLEALDIKATGVLSVQHGEGQSRLFLRAGMPVGAQVFVGFKPLGQVLLAAGLIDFQALDRSLSEMAASGKPQGQVLVEMGAVTQEQLDRALAEQQAAYVGSIAALDGGAYAFDAAATVPEWTRSVRVPALRVIVDALEKPQAGALVDSAVGQAEQGPGRVVLGPGYAASEASFGWTPGERERLESLRRPSSIDGFLAGGGLPRQRAKAMLAALLLLGLAEPAEAPAGEEGSPARSAELDADAPLPAPVVDLTEIGEPVEPAAAPAEPPGRRSDPAESRQRRQRLLARAMQNLGVGPRPGAPPAGAPAPGARPSAGEPRAELTPAEASLRRALQFVAPRTTEKDLFLRLGVARGASREEVKQAYLTLARQFHPDKFAAPALAELAPVVKDLFAALNEAHEILTDNKKRAEYLARTSGGGGARPGSADLAAAQVDFKKAEACVKTRDFARARGYFEAAIRADPRPEYLAGLAGCILLDPGSRDRARVEELLAEARKDPACDRAFYLAGVAARDEQDLARAEQMFRGALQANPRNVDAQRELGLVEAARRGQAPGRDRK